MTGHLFIASPSNIVVGGVSAPNNIGPSQIISPYVICPWYGFNAYVNNSNPVAATYLANGNAGVIYQDGSGNLQFYIAQPGVAGMPIPGWVAPLTLLPSGQVNVGGSQNIANPLQILAGSGGDANIIYNLAGVRQWSAGCYQGGTFTIADNSAGALRWQIQLDGSIDQWGIGTRYVSYSGHTFAFLWDGSFTQIVVDGGSQGQYAPIGFNDGRYIHRGGDSDGGAYTFGYVGSTGNMVALGSIEAGYLLSTGNVTASNGAVSLTQYGIQFADFGGNIFSMRWDGSHCWIGIDDNWSWAEGTGAMLVTTADGRFNRPGFYGGNAIAFGDSDNSTWYLNTYRSDARVKENVRSADPNFDSLAAIVAIPTFAYDRTDVPKHVPFGWMGGDIQSRLPDGVEMRPIWEGEPDGYHLDIQALLCHAYRAIRQLNARITTLEARV